MPGFLTDEQAKARVAGLLQLTTGTPLQGFWADTVTDSNALAYGDIVAALLGRGFTLAQIAAWDQGAAFQARQMLFYALSAGATTKPVDGWNQQAIDALDCRDRLSGNETKGIPAVQVTTGYVPVDPGDATLTPHGAVGFGTMKNATDRWVMDDWAYPEGYIPREDRNS